MGKIPTYHCQLIGYKPKEIDFQKQCLEVIRHLAGFCNIRVLSCFIILLFIELTLLKVIVT